jgi:hypothetical protein
MFNLSPIGPMQLGFAYFFFVYRAATMPTPIASAARAKPPMVGTLSDNGTQITPALETPATNVAAIPTKKLRIAIPWF